MHIVYLHQYFNTPDMIGSTRSYEMARRLVASGHTVDMITSDRTSTADNQGWRIEEVAGIRVHWIGIPYSNTMSHARRIKSFFDFSIQSARKAASITGADVVFATSTPLTIALPGAWAARRRKIPMVLEIRDLWPEAPISMGVLSNPLARLAARTLERFAYANSAHVVALAPGMAEGVENSGYPRDQITVIPNGCDIDLLNAALTEAPRLRSETPWLGDRPLVAYLGALGIVNRVDYLARVAAHTRSMDPEVRFVVVGEGRERDRIEQVARDLDILNRNFFMIGGLPKREALPWMAAADIAAILTAGPVEILRNSVQNKFFDALAAGTPVAHNFYGWSVEIATEAGAGIQLPEDDYKTAAEMLVRTLHDKRWLADAHKAARSLAVNRFERGMLAAQLEAVLRDVTSK